MNPIRKLFLKLFAFALIFALLQKPLHLGMEWRQEVWILTLVLLVGVIVPPLGIPFFRLKNGYFLATSQGQRFFQGVGTALLVVALYRLLYLTPEGGVEALARLHLGSFPAGDYRWWGATGVLLFLLGLIPPLANILFGWWMKGAEAIQFVMSRVILTLVYALAVLPVGLTAKLAGKRFLQNRLDPGAKSYWVERPLTPFEASRYKRQF